MKEVKKDQNTLVKTALQLFVGNPIKVVSKFDGSIVFTTDKGVSGLVEKNLTGECWDIWVGEEVIYEIEDDILSIMEHNGNDESLFDLYNYVKTVDYNSLKDKSKLFLDIVKNSIENLLLNHLMPIEGEAQVGNEEVIYKNKVKIRINLN